MPKYEPSVFAVADIEQAKAIILTPSVAGTTEQRWENETPIVAEQLARDLKIEAGHLVLDYGCGIGRLAKALIERTGCGVIGADISISMVHRIGLRAPRVRYRRAAVSRADWMGGIR